MDRLSRLATHHARQRRSASAPHKAGNLSFAFQHDCAGFPQRDTHGHPVEGDLIGADSGRVLCMIGERPDRRRVPLVDMCLGFKLPVSPAGRVDTLCEFDQVPFQLNFFADLYCAAGCLVSLSSPTEQGCTEAGDDHQRNNYLEQRDAGLLSPAPQGRTAKCCSRNHGAEPSADICGSHPMFESRICQSCTGSGDLSSSTPSVQVDPLPNLGGGVPAVMLHPMGISIGRWPSGSRCDNV